MPFIIAANKFSRKVRLAAFLSNINQISTAGTTVIYHSIISRRDKRRGLYPTHTTIGRAPTLPSHLGLHLPDETESTTRRTEHHPQPRAGQRSQPSFRLAGTSRPHEQRHTGHGGNNRHTVVGTGHVSPVGQQARADQRTFVLETSNFHNLGKWHIDLQIANPKSERAVVENVDRPDGVVPEPRHDEQVGERDGNDGAVGAERYGGHDDKNEESLEDDEAELEGWYI